MSALEIDGPRRMAWLLATSRMLSPATAALGRDEFTARIRADGLSLDSPRLSRLESGSQRSTLPVLAAYERETGQARGSFVAVDSLVARVARGPAALRDHKAEPAVLDELVERVATGEAMAGDWLEMASAMVGYDRIYMNSSTWTAVTTSLLGELTRAIGPAYVQRHEAAVLLLSHEHVRGNLTKTLGRFVMHPGAQIVTPALTLLAEVGDAAAADLVLRLMSAPTQLLRSGATSVVATLAGRGDLSVAQVAPLEHYVGHAFARAGSVIDQLDAIELAAELPTLAFDRVLAAAGDPLLRRRATRARRHSELVDPDVARSMSDGLAARVERSVGRNAQDPDQMLARLLREALFHLRRERRHLAAALLGASRYAPAVAKVVLEVADSDDDLQAATSWSMLRRLGPALTREEMAPVVLAETRPGVRARGLIALSICRGPVPDHVAHTLAQDAAAHESTSVRHAAMSVLGMAGHPALHRLRDLEATHAGACWWLTLGSAVDDGPHLI